MELDQFWQIISQSRQQTKGSPDNQTAALAIILRALSPAEIIEFKRDFTDCMDRAYHWDLWGAAYIIGGGCSDDSFIDFRSWLISMGREIYQRVLSNAEDLAD